MAHKDLSASFSRRLALRAGGIGLVTLAGARAAAFAADAKKNANPKALVAARPIPIALQLYSVRGECEKDFDAALERIAALGFDGVEFAGYYKYADDAAGLRKKLDALKLKAAGTHIGAGSFGPDKLDKTVAFHKTLGCKFLIVPGDKRFADPAKAEEYAQVMTAASKALKPHGLFCGHHNHTGEFRPSGVGDKTYWDLFAERTPADVILQQDTGWTSSIGLDPAALVRKYPGRTRTTHIKAKPPKDTPARKPIVGQDTTDWKALVRACREVGGTEWFTIEQEEYPDGLSPIASVERSLAGFRAILNQA